MMRVHRGFATVLALALASGCSLYFGDDDDSSGDDVPPPLPDASPSPIDASPVPTPDAAPGCQTVDEFLTRFGACMQMTDWESSGMCDVPNQATVGEGACTACHASGEDRAFLNADCAMTFTAHRGLPYIRGLVRALGDSNDCLTGFGNGALLMPNFGGPHPDFSFTEARVTAINDFVAATFARVNDPNVACE